MCLRVVREGCIGRAIAVIRPPWLTRFGALNMRASFVFFARPRTSGVLALGLVAGALALFSACADGEGNETGGGPITLLGGLGGGAAAGAGGSASGTADGGSVAGTAGGGAASGTLGGSAGGSVDAGAVAGGGVSGTAGGA